MPRKPLTNRDTVTHADGPVVSTTLVENRPDYVKCIAHGHADHHGFAYCGRKIEMHDWRFGNIDHAVLNRGRCLPCPECVAKIVLLLTEYQQHEP